MENQFEIIYSETYMQQNTQSTEEHGCVCVILESVDMWEAFSTYSA